MKNAFGLEYFDEIFFDRRLLGVFWEHRRNIYSLYRFSSVFWVHRVRMLQKMAVVCILRSEDYCYWSVIIKPYSIIMSEIL